MRIICTQSILQRVTYVSCRGYVCTPQSVRLAVNQGGTADNMLIRP